MLNLSNRCVQKFGASPLMTSGLLVSDRHYSHTRKTRPKHHHHDYSSSDDEDVFPKRGGRIGFTTFWRTKMRTFHNILDVNKDGVISFHDFTLFGDRFISLGHLDLKESKELRNALKNIWESQWGNSISQFVKVEDFLEDMTHVLNDRDTQRAEHIHSFLPYLFRAVDKDNSGQITIDEYKLHFACLGLGEDDAKVAFKAIDVDDDGKLSKEEFVMHGRDFLLTEDPERVSRHFWGPLVHH